MLDMVMVSVKSHMAISMMVVVVLMISIMMATTLIWGRN